MMWYLVLIMCAGIGSCHSVLMPGGAYPTEAACIADGKAQKDISTYRCIERHL